MEFHRLTPAFYAKYADCAEMMLKPERPYYVLLLEIDGLCYAVPLRSHIKHSFCFSAVKGDRLKSGLDFSKSVVITDRVLFVDPSPVSIRQTEFDVMREKVTVT